LTGKSKRNLLHFYLTDLTAYRNYGSMVLNIPGKPDGTIDSKEIAVLDAFTAWMQLNGEAISLGNASSTQPRKQSMTFVPAGRVTKNPGRC